MKSKRFKKSPNYIELLVNRLKKEDMLQEEFLEDLKKCETKFFQDPTLELELLISNGLPIKVENNRVILKTSKIDIKDQPFCIVDIETTSGNANSGQIIEIGAVKFLDGEIIETYQSLVYCKEVPQYVQDITNITTQMLQNAPRLKYVLEEFKLFLEDDIFVAHDIKFDYKFISDSFEKYNLGELQNRKLCTIDLAKRTIFAQRYGLDYLKELLNINIYEQHRALNDALSTTDIFKKSLQELPKEVLTPEDLIQFSKSDSLVLENLENIDR